MNLKIFVRLIQLFFTFCACVICVPAFSEESTLCHKHEEIYFSCHAENKIVSVCASGNISPKNGYVQYRFGSSGNIELEYPKLPYPPKRFFSISDVNEGNVQSIHLKFKSERYEYVIHSGFPSGLYVKKAGVTVSNLF